MDAVEEYLGDRLRGRAIPADLRRLVELTLEGAFERKDCPHPFGEVRLLAPGESHPLVDHSYLTAADLENPGIRANVAGLSAVAGHTAFVAHGFNGKVLGYWMHPDETGSFVLELDTEGGISVSKGGNLVTAMVLSYEDDDETFARIGKWDARLVPELERGRNADAGEPKIRPDEVLNHAEDAERARIYAPLIQRITATDAETSARTAQAAAQLEDGDALTGLLGKPLDDPDLGAALSALGVAAAVGRMDVTAHAHGISLRFRLVPKPSAPGALLLHEISFQGEPSEASAAYAGRLPRGLHVDDTREAVRERLGAPGEIGRFMPTDRWDDAATALTVHFRKQGPGLRKVAVARR